MRQVRCVTVTRGSRLRPAHQRTVGVKKSRPDLIAIVFIIISGSLVYSNVLHGPFLVDDIRYIRDNPTIRELSGFLNLSGTRYIAFLSFALNYAVGGPDTFGYHLVNMVIHILNGILVYLLVTALFSTPAMEEAKERWSRAVAFTASILFTVHPLQTQAVSYITQRFTSLAAFFYLSAVLLYILSRLRETGGRRAALYALAFLSGLLAQKTKEISFTLPAAIALVEAAFFTGGAKRRILRVLPFVILFAVIPIELFMPGPGPEGMAGRLRLLQLQDMARFSTKDYFLTELPILVTYLRLVFLPAGQTIDHDYTVYHSFFRAPVVASFFFLSVLFFGALYVLARSRRGRPLPLLASFGVVWFFMTISVESSIVPIKDAFFEHRLYLPGAGLYTSIAAVLFLAGGASRVRRKVVLCLVAAAVIVLSGLTYKRNRVWTSPLLFWQDAVEKSPDRAMGYNNLGNVYQRMGDMERALAFYRKAVSLDPSYAYPHNNIGVILLNRGRDSEALGEFRKALGLKPDYPEAMVNTAMALLKLGRAEEALPYAMAAVRARPDLAPAFNATGIALTAAGRPEEAIRYLKRAIYLKPGYADAYNNLGLALIFARRYEEAEEVLRKAVAMRPSSRKYRRNLELARRLASGEK